MGRRARIRTLVTKTHGEDAALCAAIFRVLDDARFRFLSLAKPFPLHLGKFASLYVSSKHSLLIRRGNSFVVTLAPPWSIKKQPAIPRCIRIQTRKRILSLSALRLLLRRPLRSGVCAHRRTRPYAVHRSRPPPLYLVKIYCERDHWSMHIVINSRRCQSGMQLARCIF
jgi:hypothetical protein